MPKRRSTRHLTLDQQQQTQKVLKENADFLKQAADPNTWRRYGGFLGDCDSSQLNLLAWIAHLVSNGIIPLTSSNAAMLVKKKKCSSLYRQFRDQEDYEAFVWMQRSAKIAKLKKIGVGFSHILYALFNSPTVHTK